MTEQKKMWFAPKVYGRGLVPISREGWMITAGIVALVIIGAPLILGDTETPETKNLLIYLLYVTVVAIAPFFLVKTRMKGSLKWRRGVRDVDWEY